MATGVSIVLVTLPSEELAASLARTLLDEGLIACANLLPKVRSIYRWKGTVCDEPEVLMVLKAPTSGFEALRARVVELHPYETPEVVRLEVLEGHGPYLDWILGTRPDSE